MALFTAAVVAGVGVASVMAAELISSLEDVYAKWAASASLAGVPAVLVLLGVRVSGLRAISPRAPGNS